MYSSQMFSHLNTFRYRSWMILQAMFETYSDEMYLACLSVMRFGGGTSKSFD